MKARAFLSITVFGFSLFPFLLSRPVVVSAATPQFETKAFQIARVCPTYTRCTTDQEYEQGAVGISSASGATSLSVEGGRIAEARSSADLSTGKLRVFSSASGQTIVDYLGNARSDTEALSGAMLRDRVTLHVMPTITGGFTARLHALVEGTVTGVGLTPDLGFPTLVGANFEVRLSYQDDAGFHCELFCKYDFPASHILKSLHDGSFTIDMNLPIYLDDTVSRRINPTFDMTVWLNAGGGGNNPVNTAVGKGIQNAIYDFSNTAALTLEIPTGVSFTSDSGKFLSEVAPPADTTPPATAASFIPAANTKGWNNGDVTATLSATDNAGGSGVASTNYSIDNPACGVPTGTTAGCSAYNPTSKPVVGNEGKHTLYFFSVDAAGNAEAQKAQPVWIDKTAPTVTPTAATGTTPYSSGTWTNQPVTVSFACTDALSGVSPDSVSSSLVRNTEGGNQTASGSCADNAGNSATATFSGINIDLTAPTIALAGNIGSYQLDQAISISCTASDPLSNGVASGVDATRTNCPTTAGPAYSFPLGTNTITATAYDLAGNSASTTTSFTVTVSYGSLCNVTVNFIVRSAKFQALPPKLQTAIGKLGAAACNYLATANLALAPKQKAAAIAAYQQLVAGLVAPGWLTQDQANLLTADSNGL